MHGQRIERRRPGKGGVSLHPPSSMTSESHRACRPSKVSIKSHSLRNPPSRSRGWALLAGGTSLGVVHLLVLVFGSCWLFVTRLRMLSARARTHICNGSTCYSYVDRHVRRQHCLVMSETNSDSLFRHRWRNQLCHAPPRYGTFSSTRMDRAVQRVACSPNILRHPNESFYPLYIARHVSTVCTCSLPPLQFPCLVLRHTPR